MSLDTSFDTLYGQRARLVEDLRALDHEAGTNAYTAEQAQRSDRLTADIDRLDGQIKQGISQRTLEQRSKMLDSLTGTATGDSPKRREVLARSLGELLGVGTSGDHQHRSIELSEDGIYESRDLLTTTSGASVMTDFALELQSVKSQGSPIWDRARKLTTDHTRDVQYPNISAHGSAVFLAEGGALAENDPTLSTITMEAWKVGQAVQISPESEFEVAGVLDVVARDMVVNIATAVDVQLHGGDGTTEPQGLVVGFAGSSTATGVTIPTADNLIDAVFDIPAHYRQTGRFFWVFGDTTWAGVRKLKDTTNQYLWQPGLAAGQPDQLLGFDVFTDSNFASVGANAKIGAFFDADRFLVRDTPLRLERSVEYAFLNDLVSYRAIQHVDSQVLDVAAGTLITNEAS